MSVVDSLDPRHVSYAITGRDKFIRGMSELIDTAFDAGFEGESECGADEECQ